MIVVCGKSAREAGRQRAEERDAPCSCSRAWLVEEAGLTSRRFGKKRRKWPVCECACDCINRGSVVGVAAAEVDKKQEREKQRQNKKKRKK